MTDSSERSALAIIRSLGSKGIEVVAADSLRLTPGGLSKYSKKALLYPCPEKDAEGFITFMLEHVKNNKYEVLIPPGDATSYLFSYHKDDFSPYVNVAIPDYGRYIKTYDKALTIKIAKEQKIPYPKTFFVREIKDVKLIAREIPYAAVIKPRSKTVWLGNKAVIMKVTQRNYANNSKELINRYTEIISNYKELISMDYLPMIQEYIPGEEFGAEFVFANQEPKGIFVHKRIRSYPITGGASTLRESVKQEELKDLGIKILKALQWTGVAMVEFKIDSRDGTPKLMEINGRFWGSLPLAIRCGVDFPYLLYQMITGKGFASVVDYATGVRQRWLLPGDLLWFFSSLKHGKGNKVVREFVRSFTIKDDTISIKDPLPTFGAIRVMMKYSIGVMKGSHTMSGELKDVT